MTANTSPSPVRRYTHVAVLALVALLAAVALTAPGTASAATPCGKKVLADWFDNGRIDRLYPLHCYEEAIDAIPRDLRDYADAEEVISRALQAAVNGKLAPGGDDPTPGDDPIGGPGTSGPGDPNDPTAPSGGARPDRRQLPRSTRRVSPRCRSRCSCSEACRSRCSPPAGSATSRAAAPRPRSAGRTRSTPTTPLNRLSVFQPRRRGASWSEGGDSLRATVRGVLRSSRVGGRVRRAPPAGQRGSVLREATPRRLARGREHRPRLPASVLRGRDRRDAQRHARLLGRHRRDPAIARGGRHRAQLPRWRRRSRALAHGRARGRCLERLRLPPAPAAAARRRRARARSRPASSPGSCTAPETPAARVPPGRISRACAPSIFRNLQVFTAGLDPSDSPPTLLGPLARRSLPIRAG